jgi:4-amino-4-deoxy-L-arabinose transferase-like glycosyltransferase
VTSTEAATGEADTTTDGVTATSVADRFAAARSVALRAFVGDRLGLVVFLGTLAFVALYWRVGIFITDNYTLANALVALADGHLAVEDAVFGPHLETPGMVFHEGAHYGRNYGQIVFALPFLWALEGLAVVVDPGLILPMTWALVLVALGRESGRVLGRPSLGMTVGAVCGLVAFAVNVAVARPLAPRLFPVAALQLSAIVATALAVVTLYRLVTRMHDRRTGVAAAMVLGLATPVGFWASLPKRHAVVVALVLGVCYALYRSRQSPSSDDLLSPLGFRALAYAIVGLSTWVHGGEAFGIFMALVVVDVPTARSNDLRSLAVVGTVFFASMIPFFVTNVLISGNPLQPPRVLSSFQYPTSDAATGGSTGSNGSGGFVQSLVDVLPPVLATPVIAVLDRSSVLFGEFVAGTNTLFSDPGRLYRVFVRGGDISGVSRLNLSQTIYLTVLEAAPVVAGVAAACAAGGVGVWRSVQSAPQRFVTGLRARLGVFRTSPAATVDAFVVTLAASFLLMYISRLPLHAQLTVRYLHPFYPLAVYVIARQASLQRVIATHWRSGLWTWAGGVLVGAQVFVVAVAAGSLGRGEAVQVHAFVGLVAAAVFALATASSVLTDRFDRATAVAGGLAAALGTDLLLLSGLAYFQYGQYALPAAGWVADLLATA